LAREYDALIITDDVYDFLQWPASLTAQQVSLDKAVLPRLVDIDRYLDGGAKRPGADGFGNTASNGSFSKICGPGLRTGWVEGTEELVRRLFPHSNCSLMQRGRLTGLAKCKFQLPVASASQELAIDVAAELSDAHGRSSGQQCRKADGCASCRWLYHAHSGSRSTTSSISANVVTEAQAALVARPHSSQPHLWLRQSTAANSQSMFTMFCSRHTVNATRQWSPRLSKNCCRSELRYLRPTEKWLVDISSG
jgi:hypothetical protein